MRAEESLELIKKFVHKNTAPVVAIMGPTGVGKSAFGITVAKEIEGEIIGADSRQVYRELSIGTGKTRPEEMEGIPHHLVDTWDPRKPFTVYDFQQEAKKYIKEIEERKRVPILLGGTGLFMNALLYGYTLPEEDGKEAMRLQLEEELKTKGKEVLLEELKEKDPKTFHSIPENNMRYVLRALEVLRLTGEKKSERTRIPDPDHQYLLLCLTKPREELYAKINARHEAMFTEGLVEEVEALYKKGYGKETPAMNTIGYKEVGDYLRGEITLERAKELVKQHARNYAKRQMTWFRKMEGIHWVEM